MDYHSRMQLEEDAKTLESIEHEREEEERRLQEEEKQRQIEVR